MKLCLSSFYHRNKKDTLLCRLFNVMLDENEIVPIYIYIFFSFCVLFIEIIPYTNLIIIGLKVRIQLMSLAQKSEQKTKK
jgi:hypothetical protein